MVTCSRVWAPLSLLPYTITHPCLTCPVMGLLPSLAGDPIQSLMGEKDSQEISLDLNLERGPETKKGYCTFYGSMLSILHCACQGPGGRLGNACPTPALP